MLRGVLYDAETARRRTPGHERAEALHANSLARTHTLASHTYYST